MHHSHSHKLARCMHITDTWLWACIVHFQTNVDIGKKSAASIWAGPKWASWCGKPSARRAFLQGQQRSALANYLACKANKHHMLRCKSDVMWCQAWNTCASVTYYFLFTPYKKHHGKTGVQQACLTVADVTTSTAPCKDRPKKQSVLFFCV